MATYTDVTQPVIVNVTKISNFSSDTHLRRMALVSEGNSKVTVGGYQSITSSNMSQYINAGTETELQATSFFSNAGNTKELILVEVGGGTLETKVGFLKNFIEAEEIKCFNYILPKSFYNVSLTQVSVIANMSESTITASDTDKVLTELQLIGFDSEKYPITVAYSTDGQVVYDVYTGTYKLAEGANKDNFPVSATLTDKTKNAQIGVIKFNHADQTGAAEATTAINYTSSYSTQDLSFVKLAQLYNDIMKEVLFFLPSPKTEDPSLSTSDRYYNDLKSVMTVKNNTQLEDTQEVTSAIVGITASNLFDIKLTMPGSSLNYKKVGITPYNYTKSMKQTLINTPYTFVDTLAGGNVVLNARMRDGKPWEFYYFWYLTNFNVTNKISSLILNGQNNPVSAVRFNQNGIDTIHSNIVAVLNNMVALGVLTTFAQGYDQSTGEFTKEGDIVVPNYYEFIKENPKDYENEILSGISCYLQIGKFVRQVQWNVTLGY